MLREFWSSWIFWSYVFVWCPFTVSAVLYAARSPWRALPVGRALMTLLASMSAVLSFVLLVLMVRVDPWLIAVLRGTTLGGVGIAGWMFLRELMVLQNRKRPAAPCPRRRSTDVP